MNRALTSLLVGAVALSFGAGCAPTPEKACAAHAAARKKADLPSDDAVEAGCVKDLTALKEKAPEQFDCLVKDLPAVETFDSAFNTELGCARKKGVSESDPGWWPAGLGDTAAAKWADDKAATMTTSMCKDAAHAIALSKLRYGIIKMSERESHQKGLETSCEASKTDAGMVANYKCMRKAQDKDTFFRCNLPGGGAPAMPGGGSQVDVIEGCVGKCRPLHPGGATPEYMTCFNACKAAGGP